MADTELQNGKGAATDSEAVVKDEVTSNGEAAAKDETATNGLATNGQVADLNDDMEKAPSWQSEDKYCDTEDFITWNRDGAVKLRIGSSGLEAMPAMTVMSMFRSTVKKFPNHNALAYKNASNEWEYVTYQQYYSQTCATAKAFIKLGLEPFKGVSILGFNSREWFLSNFGAIFAGGLSAGIYTTNSPEACAYVANSSETQICVVENDVQLKKILQVWDEIPTLKAVVQYRGELKTDHSDVYTWDDFMKLSSEVSDDELQKRMDAQYVNKCCGLIYTSGTTGTPKGVMISHDNLTYSCRAIGQFVQVGVGKETGISYLPLSHVAAQLLDMYLPVCYAATVYFAQPDALKGTLNTTMKEVQPTIFFGVPRVYEKMEEKVKLVLKAATGFRKKMLDWARGVATRSAQNMQSGNSEVWNQGLANMLVFKKVRVALGLNRCKFLYAGAAPLSQETHGFFASLGMPIMEVYGMSECTGAATMTVWNAVTRKWKSGSAGYCVKGYDYDLLDKDDKGNGEVAMIGRHVFMGYLGEKEKTLGTFDDQYRLKSGDVGLTDKDGFLFITGRIKELLITAGGENVAPVPIEDAVKEELPVISNCMLIGDRKKFLSLLVCLKTEVDTDTLLPTDNFTPEVLEWLKSLGSASTKLLDVLDGKDPLVTKAIEDGISKANDRSESRAKKIQKFSILSADFSIPGGELGPTLKLKRPVVVEKYQAVIDSLYAE